MGELFLAFLSAAAELLFEVFFPVVVEAIVALIVRSIRNVFERSNAIDPILAAIGYLFLGILFGIASVLLLPHPIFHPTKLHGISLVLSPVFTGLIMSQLGTLIRRNGKRAVRIESFGYGFTLAFGMALTRFILVR